MSYNIIRKQTLENVRDVIEDLESGRTRDIGRLVRAANIYKYVCDQTKDTKHSLGSNSKTAI